MGFSTVNAARRRKLCPAMRADGKAFKGIEWLAALLAKPILTNNGRLLAGGTGKPFAPGHFCQPRQDARLHQTFPAIEQDEGRQDSPPNRMGINSPYDQPPDSDEAYY